MSSIHKDQPLSSKKKFLFYTATILLTILFIEAVSSTALLYQYRLTRTEASIFKEEFGYSSSINIAYKVAQKLGLAQPEETTKADQYEYAQKVFPNPFLIDDDTYGYTAAPGEFVHTYLRREIPNGKWQSIDIKVTVNLDGTRWTGEVQHKNNPNMYIFGDSFVFGSGVNDEQTFAYHLQQSTSRSNIKLYALGGYSLVQAYLRFNSLKEKITGKDTIILGYASFYDERNVVDPDRLRGIRQSHEEREPKRLKLRRKHARATVTPFGEIKIDYVEENCKYNDGYCDEPAISDEEKARTSSALIKHIADNTDAKVYLLYFRGKKDNPVIKELPDNVELISALPQDFDYFMNDDIEGFDPHPGPYWHYSIYARIKSALARSQQALTAAEG